MAYPGAKVHRVSRRKLGRGQYPSSVGTTVVLSSSGTTNVTMTFARPVVVSGIIPTTVAGLTLVSQTVVSPTVVTQVWSANVATHVGTFPSNAANVTTQQGGGVAGTSVTF
jgi:hypothetical protein